MNVCNASGMCISNMNLTVNFMLGEYIYVYITPNKKIKSVTIEAARWVSI